MYRKMNILILQTISFWANFGSVIINWRLNRKTTIPRTSRMSQSIARIQIP